MATLGPPDLNQLLAQLLQQQEERRFSYLGQQQTGPQKFGAALGMILGDAFRGSPTEQIKKGATYQTAQQQTEVYQGLDPLNSEQMQARVDELLASGDVATADAITQWALSRQLLQEKVQTQRDKARSARTEADIDEVTAPFTVRERIASASGKEYDAILAESRAATEQSLVKAQEVAGQLPDQSPTGLRGAAARARGQNPQMAFHLEQLAIQRDEQLKADTEFERLIADLPKEERARLKKERANTIASGRQNVTTRTLSPQSALEIQNNLDELNRARGLVQDIQNTIQSNPSAVGLAGTVRRGAQNITEAFDSVFSLLGTKGEGLSSFTEETLNSAAEDLFETEELRKSFVYDPDVARLKNLENSLIYVIARSRQPTGKLLASTVALAKQDASLTGFTGASSVNDRMNQVFNALTVASADLESARNFYASPEMIEALERNRSKPVELSPTSQGAVPTPTIPNPSAIQAELERRKAAGQP